MGERLIVGHVRSHNFFRGRAAAWHEAGPNRARRLTCEPEEANQPRDS